MRRLGRFILIVVEIAILSGLILATRCANYPDVFVGGNVYFTDPDCYARMTRVRLCAQHPGTVVRHHDFENFPEGTIPHATAPLDYLILGCSVLFKPFTPHAIDLAGALISPMFALLGGWFLWWWSRCMNFRFRWALLILYAVSPILVHGAELGRPDHQSLLILLVTVAICTEWSLQRQSNEIESPGSWAMANGIAWGLAFWVSFYEPLLILLVLILVGLLQDRHLLFGRHRRNGWIAFGSLIVLALLIERRIPTITPLYSSELFRNWARTIGELAHVSPLAPIWFQWAGYMIVIVPILIWLGCRRKEKAEPSTPLLIVALLLATYLLTIWQARWGYFFMSIFVIALPRLLEAIKSRAAVWVALMLSILPILRDWDGRIWPTEVELARRLEKRNESVKLRELTLGLMSSEVRPFLAPWWLSPAVSYWSGQPGVAGSSHEGLSGIADSARFFLATEPASARKILEERQVSWVIAYDSDRVAANSAAIIGNPIPPRPLCQILDRTPGQAPPFLVLSGQDGVDKLFRVANNR